MILAGFSCFANLSLAEDLRRIVVGPAEITFENDRYSGIGTLTVNYRGYLHTCDDSNWTAVTALFIFHNENGTQIFERAMHRLCERSSFLPHNVGFFRTLEFQDPRDREFWRQLRSASYLELAFVKNGAWDSDYGRNFPVDL
jgi:hypothetical protein